MCPSDIKIVFFYKSHIFLFISLEKNTFVGYFAVFKALQFFRNHLLDTNHVLGSLFHTMQLVNTRWFIKLCAIRLQVSKRKKNITYQFCISSKTFVYTTPPKFYWILFSLNWSKQFELCRCSKTLRVHEACHLSTKWWIEIYLWRLIFKNPA